MEEKQSFNNCSTIAQPSLNSEEPCSSPRKILITGANSYVGTSFEKWLGQWPERYVVDTVDMVDGTWREKSFSGYDVVFHVAGIAHVSADPSKESLYMSVNRDLAIETAKKAKEDGVGQFVYMSSMIIYGGYDLSKDMIITRETQPAPEDFYGKSKLEADIAIQAMADDKFIVSIMRPPVIYGPGCKGNFPRLIKLAKYAFIFPDIDNRHSMIYIDNFCEFVKQTIDDRNGGVFFPQNKEYVSTKNVISTYRKLRGKSTVLLPMPNLFVKLMSKSNTFSKAFGSKIYTKALSSAAEYNVVGFDEGIARMIQDAR